MILKKVNEQLLTTNNLDTENLYFVLEELMNNHLDYADLYFQRNFHESWILQDNLIKSGSYQVTQGVGIRAIHGDKTGFAYTDQINLNSLYQNAQAASNIAKEKIITKCIKFAQIGRPNIYNDVNPLQTLTSEDKISLLHRINRVARNNDKRVQQVNISLNGSYDYILIVASDGTLAADIRPLVRLSINVLVEDQGKREYGSCGGGARTGYEFFLKKINGEVCCDYWAKEAVRIAILNLHASEAPAGTMPVVLGSGWPGILLHEAVGHGLEGDFNRRGSSMFSDKLGQLVAPEFCTVVDNGLLNNLRGSLAIDDEGVPGQYNILIEKGILKKYMQDKLNARLMNMHSTGNGRRESYAHLPMPRMTNTYMLNGESTQEDIIHSVDFGIYAPMFSGGQVDITSGKFVFSTAEAYLIKKGKITQPIKGAMLIGSGIEAMRNISMVGNDLKLDNGTGICGKNGQNIPVGVGQPTLKVDSLTVGGTI